MRIIKHPPASRADTAWTCRKRLVDMASLAIRTGFGCVLFVGLILLLSRSRAILNSIGASLDTTSMLNCSSIYKYQD